MIRAASIALFCAAITTAAKADMTAALDACLDLDLTIPTRAKALESSGWARSASMERIVETRAHALFIGNASGFDAESWAATWTWAKDLARSGRVASEMDNVVLLLAPTGSAAVALEPNSVGLQTCLYTGSESDLSPVRSVLDGKAPSRAGAITRLRGEAFRALVSAHQFDRNAATTSPLPLSYTTTFTVVLDRTEDG